MKEIKILFGEMGAGKNYWGEFLTKRINEDRNVNYVFLDGDTVATPEMLARVGKFKPLTREMIEDFINVLLMAIMDRAKPADGLVVAQALYFDEDRDFLEMLLSSLGYKVEFYWVKPPFWRNLVQLFSRKNGIRWIIYWLMNKPFFQKPTHKHQIMP